MNNQTHNNTNQQDNFKHRQTSKPGYGIVFGAILGLIIGSAYNNMALGLIFGAGAGLILRAAFDQQFRKESATSEEYPVDRNQ